MRPEGGFAFPGKAELRLPFYPYTRHDGESSFLPCGTSHLLGKKGRHERRLNANFLMQVRDRASGRLGRLLFDMSGIVPQVVRAIAFW